MVLPKKSKHTTTERTNAVSIVPTAFTATGQTCCGKSAFNIQGENINTLFSDKIEMAMPLNSSETAISDIPTVRKRLIIMQDMTF